MTRISSIRFHNFKRLSNFSIALHEMNVLVGPNNAGKSTVISALRLLQVALRRARSRNPERIKLPDGTSRVGHRVSTESMAISLENVSTNYNEVASTIEFRLTGRNRLELHFAPDGACFLTWDTQGRLVSSAGRFRTEFPLDIHTVPVLGPLEHEEVIVSQETVRESLASHRASRHFRNYWRYFPDGWDEFRDLVASTWPGMVIKRPELVSSNQLAMYVSEDRIDREVYWSGFGFQIWCQLLTHISRSSGATLLAIDEPEIYLHPDVQRQLLGILRDRGCDVLLSTHSVEIIGEADPAEILLIEKGRTSAQRLRDFEGVQVALDSIGSAQNVTLAQLARTKKIVFMEGDTDYKTVRRFAKRLGFDDLAAGSHLTRLESGGFSSWSKVKAFAWGAKKAINETLLIFALYDRDYRCSEEVKEIEGELRSELTDAVITSRKEMENYLLDPDVLQRVVDRQVSTRRQREGSAVDARQSVPVLDYLDRITESIRIETQAQYLASRRDYAVKSHLDTSTLNIEVITEFETLWRNLESRMELVPGKRVLRELRAELKRDLQINLTDVQIIEEFRLSEVPSDVKRIVERLERFRLM